MTDKVLTNIDFCVTSMNKSLAGSAEWLQVELAVSLLVYSNIGDADINAKKVLRQVYASAGRFDCLTPDSPSYQTIARRMQRSAGLFEKLGAKKISKIINGKKDQEALDSIVSGIKSFQLMSWDDVEQFATGVPKKAAREPKTQKEHKRRATDAEGTIHIETSHIRLDIPPEATAKEIMELARKLIQVAESAKLAA
jgi:hypothetical protein